MPCTVSCVGGGAARGTFPLVAIPRTVPCVGGGAARGVFSLVAEISRVSRCH